MPMTKEDRERALSDAASHMALAQSALAGMIAEGSHTDNGRDIVLARKIYTALGTQRGAVARRLKLGRYKW